MDLQILQIDDKGVLDKEVVWLEATDVCRLEYYMICDTTYTSEGSISNEVRHIFWFGSRTVAKGDLIALRTKVGTATTGPNNRRTTTHTFYWNLGSTIWNKDGDAAVLFQLTTWKTTKA